MQGWGPPEDVNWAGIRAQRTNQRAMRTATKEGEPRPASTGGHGAQSRTRPGPGQIGGLGASATARTASGSAGRFGPSISTGTALSGVGRSPSAARPASSFPLPSPSPVDMLNSLSALLADGRVAPGVTKGARPGRLWLATRARVRGPAGDAAGGGELRAGIAGMV